MNPVILISANAEWRAVRQVLPEADPQQSPLGEWFTLPIPVAGQSLPVRFFHGGWGKIAAAASTQYVIAQWAPDLLVNLGTCGGFEGEIERGTVLLVERTLVYDILEQMGGSAAAIDHYTTEIDLSWVGTVTPSPVMRSLLVSADRDLVVSEIPFLKKEFGAVAGDWESGAIAWVARRNNVRLLILRGVTDLVGAMGGEAYDGKIEIFQKNTLGVMKRLIEVLPAWLERAYNNANEGV